MRDRERKRAGRWGLNCGDLPWPRGMSGSPVAVVDEVSGSALQAHQSAQSGDGAANGEPVDEAESPSAKAPGIGFSAKRLVTPTCHCSRFAALRHSLQHAFGALG